MKPNGRDHKTDPVLKRLVALDHANLNTAQVPDVHDEDDGGNRAPQLVVAPLIRPARSLRNLNAEDEAPLHIDEINAPPRKWLSKMEKALLRRVEFGSACAIDNTKLRIT